MKTFRDFIFEQIGRMRIVMLGGPGSGKSTYSKYLIDHFDKVMKQIDFYDQENPKQVRTRVRRLIKRLQPDNLETGILRGFLSKIEQILNKKN